METLSQMLPKYVWSFILIYTHILTADTISEESFHPSTETKLTDALLTRYKKYNPHIVRPVLNANDSIQIQFGMSLIQILDFNEREQKLTVHVWKKYAWKDEFLTWDPAEYDGLQSTLIHASKLWIPDIILYNNAGDPKVDEHNNLFVVDYQGTVAWIPAVRYQSSCAVDMTEFPFDEQTCKFRYGSWTHSDEKLDLQFYNGTEKVELTDFLESPEWHISANTAIRRSKKYDCCPVTYSDLIFSLTFKRQVTFHMRLILVPTMLLSLLACSIFWIPPNRPDRTTLGLSLFSAFFLLLISILSNSPAVRESKLGRYYVVVILLVSFGVLYSVVIINVSLKETRPPSFINKFLIAFGCCLCTRAGLKESSKPSDEINQVQLLNGNAKIPDKKDIHEYKERWQKFAIIIDRFVFLLYVSLMVLALIFIFPCPLCLLYS